MTQPKSSSSDSSEEHREQGVEERDSNEKEIGEESGSEDGDDDSDRNEEEESEEEEEGESEDEDIREQVAKERGSHDNGLASKAKGSTSRNKFVQMAATREADLGCCDSLEGVAPNEGDRASTLVLLVRWAPSHPMPPSPNI
ncbi:hypothetical protein Syun_019438 [Stephania yunnanensis]|uniref:Uncharacterized protein n=1 Tax=Stephania yunnanensis TaxID=152371 RepID=A0AAP0IU49_9MAGN